jgi:hypothetical protein
MIPAGILPPVIHYRDERSGQLVLFEPYVIRARGFSLHLAAGYRWNGPSVPHAVRSLLDDDDCGVAPALGHDFLYGCGGRCPIGTIAPVGRVVSRTEADRLFLVLMREAGVARWKRRAAYLAVRLFGASHWRGR